MVRFLRTQFPNAARHAEAALIEGVGAQISNARGYGFRTEQQIATYVTTAWALGARFDHDFPAVVEVLRSRSSLREKAAWLQRFTKETFRQLEATH